MMRPSGHPDDEPSLFHLILGTPDPDCPVCRAHGIELPEGGKEGLYVVDTGLLRDLLDCPCPLCAEARKRMPEGG
jgi:hypothetical protein